MRRNTEMVIVVLLAGMFLGGCGLNVDSVEAIDIRRPENVNTPKAYVGEAAVRANSPNQASSAVDAALGWADKYADISDKRDLLQKENQELLATDKKRGLELVTLRTDLASAEKELAEANEMLMQMQKELANWKRSVIGFRNEMRRAQKAQIEATMKVLELVGGEVAVIEAQKAPTPSVAVAAGGEK